MTDPIRKSLTVPLPHDAAFDLFARRLGTWWPGETHSVSARDGAAPRAIEVDGKEGGRITETRPDGGTAIWGEILTWQPGRTLRIAWHPGRDSDDATDLLVTFTPVDGGTRVDLVHGGFDRLADAVAMQRTYTLGWDPVLARFLRAVQALMALA